jgi:HAD superfamily phosphatase (TIGR01668 family)
MKHWYTRFIPRFYLQDIFRLPVRYLYQQGYRHLLFDLDNTLAAYDHLLPSEAVKALIQACQDAGMSVTIISNNKKQRVGAYANALQVGFLEQAGKPKRTKLLNFLTQKGYAKGEVILIGDQLLTDVWLANRLGIASIFVDKRVSYDHWPTRINRFFESKIKRMLIAKGWMKPWEVK